ncbi:sodium:solute symporter family protein [Thaumasiovibrio subtropicus]|uniref:sodium:solute symporter family protein n=1 Tax=Thaumasiovibrio subtropicus TaxID=1891207 RepID=UPI000B34D59D|nr:sodium:solute symporter family protein [Thaumasiovibrio subtropicus]
MTYDYIVIAGYFVLMVAISVLFKKMASKSTSDYFRGGGKMLWWMVGSTAFMCQFSAWTFTGAAGKAFTDGMTIMSVFLANCVAYLCAHFFFARRYRQMRVDTPTEGIKRRFGDGNEQFFTWAIIPLSILSGGVWLNGLGVFASAVFEADVNTTIFVTGAAVLVISLLSGAWGVVASDFVQTLVIAVVSIACAIVALVAVGGPSTIVTEFPSGFVTGPDMNYPLLLVCTFIFFIVKQVQNLNNMQDAYRFLSARDSKHANKAALMGFFLMLAGSFIWFIPPWATAILNPDAAQAYPELGAKAADAVFLVFAREWMPVGTIGLLMAGLFAATMSSMDSALNRNSGIFVRSFYSTIVRKGQASDKELLRAGQLACVVNGGLVILMAQFFNSLKEMSLFDLMMSVSTLVTTPILVPLFLAIIVKKTPKWAPWATVVFGMFVSWLCMNVLTPQWFAELTGMGEITGREASELRNIITIAAHLFLTAGFFVASKLFYKEPSAEDIAREEAFFADIERPVIADSEQDEYDRMQRMKLGTLVTYMGLGLVAMVLIPNPLWGRLVFVGCSGAMLLIGYLLKKSAEAEASIGDAVTQS